MTATQFQAGTEKEDTDLNQYWYSPLSIDVLVKEIQLHATKAAFLSVPSLYFSLTDAKLKSQSKVFEFDKRWSKDPGFVFYDFNKPDQVPVHLLGAFDYIVVDPPFISREVWTKYAETVKLLAAPDCKFLFTSVVENHPILEDLCQAPLFIPNFRPTIPNLTYQYHCFLNYPSEHHIQRVNPEIPPEDPKIKNGREMTNAIRESEKDLTALFHRRDRTGEQLLPRFGAEGAVGPDGGAVLGADANRGGLCKELASDPAVQWKTVPKGLTEYADGAAAPPANEPDMTKCAEFVRLQTVRSSMEAYKKTVDKAFTTLEKIARMGKKLSEDDQKALILEKNAAMLKMKELTDTIKELSPKDATGVCVFMDECHTALSQKETFPLPELKEIVADATMKFKSPVFNRMKDLLAEMKVVKKKFIESNKDDLAAPADSAQAA